MPLLRLSGPPSPLTTISDSNMATNHHHHPSSSLIIIIVIIHHSHRAHPSSLPYATSAPPAAYASSVACLTNGRHFRDMRQYSQAMVEGGTPVQNALADARRCQSELL